MTDPAAARKRRKEIMQSLRAENAKKDEAASAALPPPVEAAAPPEEALPPKKRKVGAKAKKMDEVLAEEEDEEEVVQQIIETEEAAATGGIAKMTTVMTADGSKKTQIRYDPETPMDKDQLAAWRREARRVRNRESAAASRQRIRDRINELETEVDEWKSKYSEAVNRLAQLERCRGDAE